MKVAVIASGETERRALPHLIRPLAPRGIDLVAPIMTPPNHRALTPVLASKLVSVSWFRSTPEQRPSKYVVLVDADGKDPESVCADMRMPPLIPPADVPVPIIVTAAKWHLEAWFFADEPGLRAYVKAAGGRWGKVDCSEPDTIENPKQRHRSFLKVPYTAAMAGEIAASISLQPGRSPSFDAFVESLVAVR